MARSNRSTSMCDRTAVAVLLGQTHYNVQPSPTFPTVVTAFLNGLGDGPSREVSP